MSKNKYGESKMLAYDKFIWNVVFENECNKKQETIEELKKQITSASGMIYKRKCENCNHITTDINYLYCPICGTKLKEQI